MADQHPRETRIADRIDEWHHAPENGDVPLHEWLGWTWAEYAVWVERSIPPAPREGAL